MWENIKYFASHGIIYVGASVLAIFILWSAFIKTTNATKYTAPVTQNHELENPRYAPFSCARIIVQKEK